MRGVGWRGGGGRKVALIVTTCGRSHMAEAWWVPKARKCWYWGALTELDHALSCSGKA